MIAYATYDEDTGYGSSIRTWKQAYARDPYVTLNGVKHMLSNFDHQVIQQTPKGPNSFVGLIGYSKSIYTLSSWVAQSQLYATDVN